MVSFEPKSNIVAGFPPGAEFPEFLFKIKGTEVITQRILENVKQRCGPMHYCGVKNLYARIDQVLHKLDPQCSELKNVEEVGNIQDCHHPLSFISNVSFNNQAAFFIFNETGENSLQNSGSQDLESQLITSLEKPVVDGRKLSNDQCRDEYLRKISEKTKEFMEGDVSVQLFKLISEVATSPIKVFTDIFVFGSAAIRKIDVIVEVVGNVTGDSILTELLGQLHSAFPSFPEDGKMRFIETIRKIAEGTRHPVILKWLKELARGTGLAVPSVLGVKIIKWFMKTGGDVRILAPLLERLLVIYDRELGRRVQNKIVRALEHLSLLTN